MAEHETERRLSDGSKAPSLPRWLIVVMLVVLAALFGFGLAHIGVVVEFVRSLRE